MILLPPVVALIAASVILAAGSALQTVLLPLRAGIEGFPTLLIGLVGSAHNVGFVLGCLATPWLVARFGHVRSFTALATAAAAVALGYPALPAAEAWLILRLGTGLTLAGLSVVLESWLNASAGNGSRGRTLAFYMTVTALASTGAQMTLPLADPAGWSLFAAVAVALLASAAPLAMARSAPPILPAARLGLRQLYRISPVGVIGCFAIGLANGAFWQLAPLYAQQRGLSTTEVAVFMSAVVAGGALGQWPLGRLSDRMDRRRVIVGALLAAILADLLMAAPGWSLVATMVAAVVFGLCVMPIYALCVAHTNDQLGRAECVAASSGLLLAFGLGAIAGPALVSALMATAGGGALFAHSAVIHAGFAAVAIHRMRRRPPPAAQPMPVPVLRAAMSPARHPAG